MTPNSPEFHDFIAEKVGHRNWYTRPFAAPVKARGKSYIAPKAYYGFMAEYTALFGRHPVTGQVAS